MTSRVLQVALVSAPGIAAVVVGAFGGHWSREVWPWYIWATIAIGMVFLTVFFGIARKAYILEKERTVSLKIESRNQPDYRYTTYFNRMINYECRVGVRNLSSIKSIDNVTLRITRFDNDDFDAPQTVDPKKISINPGTYCNWIIVRGSHFVIGEDSRVCLNISQNGQNFLAIGKNISMTIEASADGTPPVTRDFVLRINDGCQPMLIPVDELQS